MKRGVLLLVIALVFSAVIVSAAGKIEISIVDDSIQPGENISFKVNIYDSNNNLVSGKLNVVIEDANKISKIEKSVMANEPVDIPLDEQANSGYWKITATHSVESIESSALFMVESSENVRLELNGDVLTIENIGNTPYDETIWIVIGESIGSKKISLDVGEKIDIRLTAPDGAYNVKITAGEKTLTRSAVQLTGNVVGVLDEKDTGSSPITGISPDKESFSGFGSIFNNKTLVYIFLAVVIGATILLAIERNYRKKTE